MSDVGSSGEESETSRVQRLAILAKRRPRRARAPRAPRAPRRAPRAARPREAATRVSNTKQAPHGVQSRQMRKVRLHMQRRAVRPDRRARVRARAVELCVQYETHLMRVSQSPRALELLRQDIQGIGVMCGDGRAFVRLTGDDCDESGDVVQQ